MGTELVLLGTAWLRVPETLPPSAVTPGATFSAIAIHSSAVCGRFLSSLASCAA